MKRTSVSTGRVPLIVMSGFLNAPGVWAVYESAPNERTGIQPEKVGIAETLLDFKIEEAVGHPQPSDCTAVQKLGNDRRKLDPQLSGSDERDRLNSAKNNPCKNADSSLPMNR